MNSLKNQMKNKIIKPVEIKHKMINFVHLIKYIIT